MPPTAHSLDGKRNRDRRDELFEGHDRLIREARGGSFPGGHTANVRQAFIPFGHLLRINVPPPVAQCRPSRHDSVPRIIDEPCGEHPRIPRRVGRETAQWSFHRPVPGDGVSIKTQRAAKYVEVAHGG